MNDKNYKCRESQLLSNFTFSIFCFEFFSTLLFHALTERELHGSIGQSLIKIILDLIMGDFFFLLIKDVQQTFVPVAGDYNNRYFVPFILQIFFYIFKESQIYDSTFIILFLF